MAEIKQAVIAHLVNDAAVFAVFANRIWADRIPDNPEGGPQTYPYARIWLVTSPQQYTHQGEGGRTPLTQIDIFDDDQARSDTATEIIRASLSGFSGLLGNGLSAGRTFVSMGPGGWNEEARNFRRILEVSIGTNN